jgi:hypothetical protein
MQLSVRPKLPMSHPGPSGPGSARLRTTLAVLALAVLYSTLGRSGVLPEDRADVEWNRYEGGGQTIEGKSWLIRKKVGDKVSLTYNHLIDVVSGASIDVKLAASPYTEQRTQDSVSAEYLYGKSTYSVGYIHSYEEDYRANTAFFSISQDMFGDLTTVSMTFRRGWNEIWKDLVVDGVKIHDPNFPPYDPQPPGVPCPTGGCKARMDERAYGVGLTQILTRNSILALNYEVITDQGWLANPYRQVRYLDPTVPSGFALQPEVFPNTRTSNAIGADYKYYLPYRAALDLQYRFFRDTWGIGAHTAQIGYTQPWRNWTFDGTFRFYKQNHADFYSDLFPYRDYQNFMTRSRELATFNSYSLGAGVSYQFGIPYVHFINRSTVNFQYNRLIIDYKDYREVYTVNEPAGMVGNEPFYTLKVNLFQLFLSFWY